MGDLFGHEALAVEPPDGDKGRVERGAFYTPQGLALAICGTLRDTLAIDPEAVFEPGCGGGAFLRAVAATWSLNGGCGGIHGVDLLLPGSPDAIEASMGLGDRSTSVIIEQRDLFTCTNIGDLAVGNPDFAIAERVVRHCLAQLQPGGYVAMLLLSAFEESNDRIAFWREHPLYARQAIAQRASFRADGQTDMRPYSLFVWRHGWRGPEYRGLPPLVWRAVR